MYLDMAHHEIAGQSRERLGRDDVGEATDDLCYLIYTSGTTGRPKGVLITHASICNFVRVAAEVYGIVSDDRVYQGLTIAFDFSIEEIWVPWVAGATLVPKPVGGSLIGPELDAYLRDNRVTALCCVPTLLATLDEDLPDLRFLLVSGESCPPDLVDRWHRSDRRFLNVYGPTEATVTATWVVLRPGRPVTIGIPLPTYSVVILDPDRDRALPPGELGEIGIAGIGLAAGYLNRPDLTDRAFIADFLPIPGNPTGRIYRTGDLGRINQDGEIEHHGRIDTQVKIRGYRIELTEVESVLRQAPGIAQAVVSASHPTSDLAELVAYYSARPDTEVDVAAVYEHLRRRLPEYMVPAYLEQIESVPTTSAGKVDRTRLPGPTGPRLLTTDKEYVAPATHTESVVAEHLATTLGVDRVSVDDNFFERLGANSLLMARFSASIRKGAPELPAVTMKDIYLHPTVRDLVTALTAADDSEGLVQEPAPGEMLEPLGRPRYVLCGVLQLVVFLAYVSVSAFFLNIGAKWLSAGSGMLDLYARSVVFGGAVLVAMGTVPIVAKWVLIGRWKPERINVWSMRYVRFWVVKTMVVANPAARLCVGTPLYGLYLRALGAKIGRGAVIYTNHVPVVTDLLTVRAGSVVRKDTFINGYRARAGVIEIGAVTIGAGVFVGEQSVLDIDTTMGDAAQLGHSSSLHSGQTVDGRAVLARFAGQARRCRLQLSAARHDTVQLGTSSPLQHRSSGAPGRHHRPTGVGYRHPCPDPPTAGGPSVRW